MIIDQLFTPKLIKEGEVYDLGREYGAPPPAKKPRSQDPADHNPYPYSPEEDDDYFREIFRKKREAKDQGVAEGPTDDPRFQKMMGNIQKSTPKYVPVTGYVAVSFASEQGSKKIKGVSRNGKPIPTNIGDPDQFLSGKIEFTPDQVEQQLMSIGKKYGWDSIDSGQSQGFTEMFFDTAKEYTSNNYPYLATNIVKTVKEINKFFADINKSLQTTGLPGYVSDVWQGMGPPENTNQIEDLDQIISIAKKTAPKADPGPEIGKVILANYKRFGGEDGYSRSELDQAAKIAKIYITQGERAGFQAQHNSDVSDMIDELLSDAGSDVRTIYTDDPLNPMQMEDQDVAEKIGDLRPKLGTARDKGKSVRKWRNGRGLEEQGVTEDQLDEVDWKAWQDKMKAAGQGAKEFTQNVRDTGDAAAGMINAYGGSAKELAKQTIARPTSAAYNAVKGGLGNTADVAKGVYGDVKQGTQAVGQAVDTVGTDVGQGIQKVGRGVANVAGGTVGALGSVAGGATTGLGRAGVKGFNAGVQNVGGDAVDSAETNIFKPTSTPVEIKKQIDLKKKEIIDLETQLKTATPATGGAQKSMPFYGTNPATGQARTYDELLARSQAGTTPVAPAALPKPTYASGVGATPTNVTYSPAFGGNYYKQKTPSGGLNQRTQDYINAGYKADDDRRSYNNVGEALIRPVVEMLQMVETKEDVQRIKQFVDETFARYSAVNESSFAVRNKILEHVTQVGAQRRREHSQRMAT